MANEEHLLVLRQGVEAWNAWRREHDIRWADLSGADLSLARLHGVNLSLVDLSNANLTLADLRQASLGKAVLMGANLLFANLAGADLRQSNLEFATLLRAELGGADLSDARIGTTFIADVDLASVKGLQTVRHDGPSSIGIDTLYRSGGRIPETFLRKAGVPARFIEYDSSLVGQAVQYYSCFISYAHEDRRFCDRLYADLSARRIRVWYFLEDARWGRRVWGEIDKGIRRYDKLVVICSEHSLQSEAVLKEIGIALQEEQDRGEDVLFPVRLDDYLFDKWKHEHKQAVLDRVVGDFRGWDFDHARYQTQFKRLIDALEAEAQVWGEAAAAAES